MYSYFGFYFIFKVQTNRLQTNNACIKLSYPLVVPVYADRIMYHYLQINVSGSDRIIKTSLSQ